MRDLVVYGAGGHARVIIDIVEQGNRFKIAGLVDNTGSTTELMGYPVVREISEFCDHGVRAGVIAVGDNWQRRRLAGLVRQTYGDFEFVSCVHPSARIGRGVAIGEGTVVMAGCNINPQVLIESQCIINTGANVDHDCVIREYASLAPGVTLGGNVGVGECTAIGLGTSIIHGIDIGAHVVIGAGSVVVRNVESHCIAYGNPCRKIRPRDAGSPYL